jgi:hypothetical protein
MNAAKGLPEGKNGQKRLEANISATVEAERSATYSGRVAQPDRASDF